MPLHDSMLYSAIRILNDEGSVEGTGFCLMVPSNRVRYEHAYIVTADHVVRNESQPQVEIADQFRPGDLYPPLTVTDWRRPLDNVDLSIAPFPANLVQDPTAIRLNRELIEGLEVRLGAQFFYVGVLTHYDVPMVRSGTIGAISVPGLAHDGPYDYPAHLADVRSYGGFSGSPCFLEYPLASLKPLNREQLPVVLPESWGDDPRGGIGYLYLFCGIITQHATSPMERFGGGISHLGLATLLPADTVIKALMTDELAAERNRIDDLVAKESPHLILRPQ